VIRCSDQAIYVNFCKFIPGYSHVKLCSFFYYTFYIFMHKTCTKFYSQHILDPQNLLMEACSTKNLAPVQLKPVPLDPYNSQFIGVDAQSIASTPPDWPLLDCDVINALARERHMRPIAPLMAVEHRSLQQTSSTSHRFVVRNFLVKSYVALIYVICNFHYLFVVNH